MGDNLPEVVNPLPAANPSPKHRYAVLSRKTAWFLTFVAFTALGWLEFAYRYLDDLARGHPHTFAMRMFEEMTGAYSALLLLPVLVWAVRRNRIRRNNWWRTLPLNLLIMVAFSVCDTTLMSVSRSLLSPVFGLGQYDYGIMFYRYPMEFANHVLWFWIMVGAIYGVDSYRAARDRQVAHAELETRLAEAQLQNLRLQLQPHFLFNALNTISSVMHEDVGRADAMLAQLSDLLRRTLRAANSQEVALEEELALLKNYLAIMEARFGNDLQVDFAVEPALSDALVPQLILQPLVENSIRHGRETQSSRVDIQVKVRRENGNLLLQVCDNGPGIRELTNGGWRKGVGLSNTEERLEGLYGSDHQFLLENSVGGGLTVTVRVPFHTAATAR
ncbi:MAG: histidine kinase [Acidobacteriia bacterium]|nr:histidine kinase [Terriglobia bacterium]